MKISAAIVWSLAWLWAGTAGAVPASDQKSAVAKRPVPGAELFTNGAVLRIHLEIPASNLAALRKEPRKAVRAVMTEGTNVYTDVAVHVKGSAGSTRGVDEKPALTLSFGKFTPNQKFHGLRKIHLNNSVQDPTYMNENLCGEMFRAAGVPATRVCYAMVEVNNKKFGLYVVKEGFTKEFLSLFFKKTNGNLYDMDPGHEVTEQLQRDSGDGPPDRLDLKALAAAAQEPDAAQRWQHLQQVLDVDRFISFAAMELMANHWDGYCIGRNNFRVYHDRDTDKIVFFPHGMDQMFGDPTYAVYQRMN